MSHYMYEFKFVCFALIGSNILNIKWIRATQFSGWQDIWGKVQTWILRLKNEYFSRLFNHIRVSESSTDSLLQTLLAHVISTTSALSRLTEDGQVKIRKVVHVKIKKVVHMHAIDPVAIRKYAILHRQSYIYWVNPGCWRVKCLGVV